MPVDTLLLFFLSSTLGFYHRLRVADGASNTTNSNESTSANSTADITLTTTQEPRDFSSNNLSIYVSTGVVAVGLIALFALVGVKFGKGCCSDARGVGRQSRKSAALHRGDSVSYLEDFKRRKDEAKMARMQEDHLRRISVIKGGATRRNTRKSVVGLGRKSTRKVGSKKSRLTYNQNYHDFVIDNENVHGDLDRNSNKLYDGNIAEADGQPGKSRLVHDKSYQDFAMGKLSYFNDEGHNTNMHADGTGSGSDANSNTLEENSSASLALRRSFRRTLAECHDWQAWYEMRRDSAGKKKKSGRTASIHKKSATSTIASGQNSTVDREALETDADATLQDAPKDREVETEAGKDDGRMVAVTQRNAEPRITTETCENLPDENLSDETAIRRSLPAETASRVDSEETASWTSDGEFESEEEEGDDLDESKFLDPDGKP